jgi:sugar phosphate isomerase/epimerase
MRLSCCAYSYRQALQAGKMTLPEFVQICRKTGFDGVELTAYYFASTERPYLNDLKRLAHREGMLISGTAIGSDFAHPDAGKRQEQVALTHAWIEHSEILGAPTLRVFAGAVRPGADEEQTFQDVVSCLQLCAEYAWERGVMLALENHGGLTQNASGTLRLLQAIDRPALGLNLDFGNFQGDIYAQFAACAPYAVAAHAKPFATITPGQSPIRERVDYRRVRTLLENTGYRGFLAVEYEEAALPQVAVPQFASELRAALED